MALLSLKNVSLSYGGRPLLDEVEFHIERGDRICLLGINGTGKSCMLNVLSGEIRPDSGDVARASGLQVASLSQQVPTGFSGSVMDIVSPDDNHKNDGQPNLDASRILSRMELDPSAEFSTLSGGTRRRVMLAKALIGSPDVVLLDEPTNHLDVDSIAWLEEFLLRYCRTFMFVTHDRAFLRRLATRVVELDRGHLSDWKCDYDTFLQRKEECLAAEAKQWAQKDKLLEQEETWIRRGVRARTCRNQGRVRALETLREERRMRRGRIGSVQMSIQEAERTGQVVLKAEDVSFGYGKSPLIRDFSTVLTRNDKVGILGPNGCGKTTLLKLLLQPGGCEGGLMAQSGHIVHGTNLQVAYSDQLRSQLDENRSLADNIAEGQEFVTIQGTRRHIIGYLQDFLFTRDRARQPVSVLSGGERNRLLLARLFAQPSNVLVLDEPTNDLDLDTLELLEEQLDAYKGTVILVSHDRSFLDEVVTSVLAFEKHPAGDTTNWLGHDDGWYVNEYVGGYADWAGSRVLPPEPEPVKKQQPVRPPRERVPAKRRLTKTERRELEQLPGRIEELEKEQADWHKRMADPAFFRQSGAEIAQAKQRAHDLHPELERAYARWEELSAIALAEEARP